MSRTGNLIANGRGVRYEEIAVVGLSCRLPGVDSVREFWDLLRDGVDSVATVPGDRPDPSTVAHKTANRGLNKGGYLKGISKFDAEFFNISPREARAMDPQQRLMLELGWEALEDAQIAPDSVRGSDAGVFVGVTTDDYAVLSRQAGVSGIGHYSLIGLNRSILANRLSHFLGLSGPSMAVDTGQSSSLVAIHLACESIRNGECSMALAGGIQLNLTVESTIAVAEFGALSPDGKCFTFDARANGYARGEGGGAVVLKPLSRALVDGDHVYCVIVGNAVNNDGSGERLTTPSSRGQEAVLRLACLRAQVDPATVQYVELHGTGTKVGDPIEAAALAAVYGSVRSELPLWVGSAKTNVGHLEGAAGVVGLMKTALAIKHRLLPPSLNFEQPNPAIHFDKWNLRVVRSVMPWPEHDARILAGVSSFGMGGTNCHILLASAPNDMAKRSAPADEPRTVPWVLSAHTTAALRAQAVRLTQHIETLPDVSIDDVSFSLATTRALLPHRAVVIAADRAQAMERLRALAVGRPVPGLVTGISTTSSSSARIAMLFTGQGAQRAGMGRELYEQFPVYADAFDAACRELDDCLAGHVQHALRDVIFAPPGSELSRLLDQTVYTQTGLFAFEVALFRLVESWGIRPDVLLGHSIGELSAAHVAGVLSLPDAAVLVAARGRLMQELPADGAMVAVTSTEAHVQDLLKGRELVSIAAVNSPRSVVVSGERGTVGSVVSELAAQGHKTTQLTVSHAFHSPLIDPMLEQFQDLAQGLRYLPPVIPIISTVTGKLASTEELRSPQYWVRQARQTVRFADAVQTLRQQSVSVLLELGPGRTLTAMAQDNFGEQPDLVAVALTRPDWPEPTTALAALAELFVRGIKMSWTSLLPGTGQRVGLPTYPFQRQRYWLCDEIKEHDRLIGSGTEWEAPFWDAVQRHDIHTLSTLLGIDASTSVEALLPSLVSWRQNRADRATVDSWRYREQWIPLSDTTPGILSGIWLILMDDQVDQNLIIKCVEGLGRYEADVRQLILVSTQLRRDVLANRLRAELDGQPVAGAVSFLALNEKSHSRHAALSAGLLGTLVLVQALGDVGIEAPLWCVTQGAVSVGTHDPLSAPVQSAVWGLGRVAAVEHPERWGGLIDLPEIVDDRTGTWLSAILSGNDEGQVAVRASGIFVRRLIRAPLSDNQHLALWKPQGSVLITGGTGAVGGHVARWLANRGVDHLILASRRGAAASGAAALCRELAAMGTEVRVVACDVADREALLTLLADIPAEHPLTAVIHCAGVLDDGVLDEQTPQRFESVLRPKIKAALHLHELTKDLDLSAFVVCSSLTGLIGVPGQANYAAANAFLDAFAHYRLVRGLPATCLAWGLLACDDMHGNVDAKQPRRQGILAMDSHLAMTAMGQALDHKESSLLVAKLDWENFLSWSTAMRSTPLFEQIPEAQRVCQRVETSNGIDDLTTTLRVQLAAMSDAAQKHTILEMVRAEAAAILGYNSPAKIIDTRAFQDLGFSSPDVLELRHRLGVLTGIGLADTVVYEYPSPAALAGYLWAQLTQKVAQQLSVSEEIDRLEKALIGTADDDERSAAVARLRSVLTRWDNTDSLGGFAPIKTATVDELFDFIDNELGKS